MANIAEDEISSVNVESNKHNALDVQHNDSNVQQANEDLGVHDSMDSEAGNDVATIINRHPMLTRSKCGVFKPKVYSVTYDTMEHVNVHKALQSPHLKNVILAKLEALQANGTWSLVSLPKGRPVVGCKWLFKVKKNPDGSISR
ncbi:uncharacterized mitochondrial protein AtMg00820-like [Hibiscus syriacus]|uniref:uncharacterized mitochondrial protein AtMg00820-like n=1 Tax=Hibiscus syriacus TaxID=106335 RepID=UPI001922D318|nr:uncharacterized mitochondrial protein AtMg00820-like [Hibiscus syriacus]